MTTIVIDTNLFFGALRTADNYVRDIIERDDLQFIAPNYLVVEIFIHKDTILQKSKVQEATLYELLAITLQKVRFVNEESISLGNIIEAYRLCSGIDEKDAPFVALALEYDALIWTRDQMLKDGLGRKGFTRFFDPT
ncbi:PIN domain-containing protein [Fibrella sp. WM1]|uniref:PIN domain-containing protein n=1 Tax=Fibrella musci TaxID=3242485 RepID=UPI0035224051